MAVRESTSEPLSRELLACPFCGDSAMLSRFGLTAEVMCTNCNARSPVVHATNEAKAIDAWNTRTAPQPRSDGVAERAIATACEPWQHSVGEPPEWGSPLLHVFDAGINYGAEQFAKALGVSDYEWGDGSDDYASDVATTFTNILKAAGFADKDGDLPAAIQPAGGVEEALVDRLAVACAEKVVEWINGPPEDGDELDLTDTIRAALAQVQQ